MTSASEDPQDRRGADPETEFVPDPLRQRVAVVLVEPWEPGNVGAVARAMFNLGFTDLRLVVAEPERREPLRDGDARRFATHAKPLLAAVQFHDTLESAVADRDATYAFTARFGRSRLPRATLDEAARASTQRLHEGRIALVFGTEERGLSSDDLRFATDLVRIPAPGPHPVLNLAQAVLVALWEWSRALDLLATDATPLRPSAPRASMEERAGLEREWNRALVDMGYGRTGPGTLHRRILRRFLEMVDRAGNERDDVSMLRGLAKRVFRITGTERRGR